MKTYFKVCLLSPLWFPVLLFIIVAVNHVIFDGRDVSLPEWLLYPILIMAISIVYGGLQYAVALVIIWRRINFDNAASWAAGCAVLPMLFTVIQVGSMLLLFWLNGEVSESISFIGMLAFFDLAIGYGYVFLWFVGLALIELKNRLRERRLAA